MSINTISISVGKIEITFHSLADWLNNAKSQFMGARLISETALCIDARGRVCTCGREFARADKEDAYPINVYRKVI